MPHHVFVTTGRYFHKTMILVFHIPVTERWNKFINRTSAVHHPSAFLASYFISPFLQHPSFYLLSAISSPLFFYLSTVFVLEEDSDSVSGGAVFFFFLFQLHLSFILLLYVFHAGKGSSSCMQQGVCSVWSCPIRDLIVWCYSPQPRGILSLSSSLTVILFSFPITDYFILFSYTYFLNLAPKPLHTFTRTFSLFLFSAYSVEVCLHHYGRNSKHLYPDLKKM